MEVSIGDVVNTQYQAVGCWGRSVCVNIKTPKKDLAEIRLRNVNRDLDRSGLVPVGTVSKEPFHSYHEIYPDFGLESSFKTRFELIRRNKIEKIVHIKCNVNGKLRWKLGTREKVH